MPSRLGNAVARLVGADRGTEPTDYAAAVADAKIKLESARRALSEHQTIVSKAERDLSDAQAAFDAAGTDEGADAVLAARNARDRALLFANRHARAVDVASSVLAEAERNRDLAEIERLESVILSSHAREEAVISEHGPAVVSAAMKLFDEARAIDAEKMAAIQAKKKLQERLGLHADAERSSFEYAAEFVGSAPAARVRNRISRRIREMVRQEPNGEDRIAWVVEAS